MSLAPQHSAEYPHTDGTDASQQIQQDWLCEDYTSKTERVLQETTICERKVPEHDNNC